MIRLYTVDYNKKKEKDLRGFTNKIIKNFEEAKKILNWIDINKESNKVLKVKLLYFPTPEKNSWKNFHEACDGKKGENKPTIVLCQESNNGYYWDLSGICHKDSNAFLFSLDKNKKYTGSESYIYGGKNHGPHFG